MLAKDFRRKMLEGLDKHGQLWYNFTTPRREELANDMAENGLIEERPCPYGRAFIITEKGRAYLKRELRGINSKARNVTNV